MRIGSNLNRLSTRENNEVEKREKGKWIEERKDNYFI